MSYDNTPTSSNDPEQLRREIERTRGNLSQNVNALGVCAKFLEFVKDHVSIRVIADRRDDETRHAETVRCPEHVASGPGQLEPG